MFAGQVYPHVMVLTEGLAMRTVGPSPLGEPIDGTCSSNSGAVSWTACLASRLWSFASCAAEVPSPLTVSTASVAVDLIAQQWISTASFPAAT